MAPTELGGRFLQRREQAEEVYRRIVEDVPGYEERSIQRIVGHNAETVFGREHGFSKIRTVDEYRRAVPIRDYDGLESYIERSVQGESNVLTSEPPILFRRTSGTTGANKKIPLTARSFAVDVQGLHLGYCLPLRVCPEMFDRPDTVLNLSHCPRTKSPELLPAGVKWQPYSEHVAVMAEREGPLEGLPGSEAEWWDPGQVLGDGDLTYLRARLALESDLLGITAFNPSRLISLTDVLTRHLEQLAREIRDGTVFGEGSRTPKPDRARELERLGGQSEIRPRDVWPNLKFVSTWKSASCSLYLPRVQELVGDEVELVPFPYCASDGPFAVHLDQHPSAGFLLPNDALYEFVPAEEQVKEDSETLRGHELEIGHEYHLVHTTWNGLYRYLIGDVVLVRGKLDSGVPQLEYVGRRQAFSSFTGEKLTDRHVVAAAKEAFERQNVTVTNYTCCPCWGEPPQYVFVVEPASPEQVGDFDALAGELDRRLKNCNDEYPSKRKSGRLGPVVVHVVGSGTFSRYRQKLIDQGAPAGQLKDKPLQKDGTVLDDILVAGSRVGRGESDAT